MNEITLRGLLFPRLSYGRHLFSVAEILTRLAIPIRIVPTGAARPDDIEMNWVPGHLEELIDWDGASGGHEVLIAPMDAKPKTDRTIFWTMCESTEILEPSLTNLMKAEVIATPSTWVSDIVDKQLFSSEFRDSDRRIHRIPLGYDDRYYWPHIHNRGSEVIFMAGGHYTSTGIRKNLTQVIHAFQDAFPSEDAVRLQIKVTPDSDLEPLHRARNGDDRITITNNYVTESAMAYLYRDADAFIDASFGEGFGCMLLEAMVSGTPVLSTGRTGPRDFINAENSFIADGKMVSGRNSVPGCEVKPSHLSLVRQIRKAAHDPEERYRKAYCSVRDSAGWTWTVSTLKLIALMRDLGWIPR